jgi:hypothetical protein
MSSWYPQLEQDDPGRLVALDGELIRMPPEAVPGPRRRLLVERLFDGAERVPVRITSLSPKGCDVTGPQSINDVDGKLWLRLPGFEAFQIAAVEESEGRLHCLFAQPLSSAVLNAIAHPRNAQSWIPRAKARCTLL